MTEKANESYISYRWVLLGLIWIINVSSTWGHVAVSPLARQLMTDLNMDHAQLMSVLGAPMIISILLAIPGGILTDKFGAKRMIIVAGIIAGLTGVLRGASTNYIQFFIFSVAIGLGSAISTPNFAKLVREWFPPPAPGRAGHRRL